MSKKTLVSVLKVIAVMFAATIISSAATYVIARAMGMTGNMPVLAVVVSVLVGQVILIICGLMMRPAVKKTVGSISQDGLYGCGIYEMSVFFNRAVKRTWEWVEENNMTDVSDKDIMDTLLQAIKDYNKEHNIVGYYEMEEMMKTRS